MRILVTGACGFVGGYLVNVLRERGHEVVAAVQNVNRQFSQPVRTVTFDITNAKETTDTIMTIQPDLIINLAAQSMVVKAWEDPQATFAVNVLGLLNICEVLRSRLPNCRLINIGSSEEYGLTALQRKALQEAEPCLPQNPYALSKFTAGQLLIQMAQRYGLQAIHLRPFNHFGPGQRTGYVVSDFCSQIARMEKGELEPEMMVGDLNAQRDFTDVRDVIEAYALIAEQGLPTGIYNICSGEPRRVQDILDFLLHQAKVPIRVKIDQEKLRPSDVPLFIGSASKLRAAIGWTPKRDFQASLIETLEWWRHE